MQDKFSEALNLFNAWYYSEIRSCADAAVEACVGRLVSELPKEDLQRLRGHDHESAVASFMPYRVKSEISNHGNTTQWQERSKDTDPREFLTEYVDNLTDGHQFIIYTQQAQMVLAVSDNDGAYEDEMGDKALTDYTAACFAMRADIWEHLEARRDEWDVEDISDDEIDIRDGVRLESDGQP